MFETTNQWLLYKSPFSHAFPMVFPQKKPANNSYWALETNQHGFKGWLPRVTSQKRASPVTTTCPYRFPKWIPPAKWSSHHRLSKCRDRKSTENIILYIHISYCDISQYIPMKYPHIVAFLLPMIWQKCCVLIFPLDSRVWLIASLKTHGFHGSLEQDRMIQFWGMSTYVYHKHKHHRIHHRNSP